MGFIPTSGVNRMNIIRRSHVAQLRSHDYHFRSHDFLFRFHKRQIRSEKATLLPCPWGDKHLYILLKFRKFCPTRPERAEAPSPGHHPG